MFSKVFFFLVFLASFISVGMEWLGWIVCFLLFLSDLALCFPKISRYQKYHCAGAILSVVVYFGQLLWYPGGLSQLFSRFSQRAGAEKRFFNHDSRPPFLFPRHSFQKYSNASICRTRGGQCADSGLGGGFNQNCDD